MMRGIFRVLGLAALSMGVAQAQIQFTDVTSSAGITYFGESYGASWGDQNGDALPDLFVNNHRSAPGLYINRSNGVFENRFGLVDIWQQSPNDDQHGGTWADFDNDGDQDLMIALGSRDPTQFLVNGGGVLSNQIDNYTIDPARFWQGRMPVWVDFNNDGLLDFAMSTTNGPFHLFQRSGADFIKKNSASGSTCSNNAYGQLADVNYDGQPELICAAQSSFPHRIYDYSTMPFIDLTALIPVTTNSADTAFADFDGDLRDDLFITRGKIRVSGAEAVDSNSVEGHIITNNHAEQGFTFRSTGDITFTIHWSARNISNVRIGSGGMNPVSPPGPAPITFTVSPNDPNVVGIEPHGLDGPTSVYIGYEPSTNIWTFINKSGDTVSDEGAWSYIYVFADSTAGVNTVTPFGLTAGDKPFKPVLYTNPTGNAYVDTTVAAQLNIAVSCTATAAADFDNDMDTDIYLVCRNAVSNAQDILYQNNGGGVFTAVPNAGGATGPVGFGVGLGENVALADFDIDGFVDIFQVNGLGLRPENPFPTGGPDKLYRNSGNSNHWIELDLIGTTSNRSGIGAVVTATAGTVTQRKTQNGGYHRWAQNHSRQHFGLAGNATVDLQILWPSGILDVFSGVAADHLYKVTEAGSIVVVPPPGDPGPAPPSPCGEPGYDKAVDRGVFIWKDCVSEVWSMRVSPGNTSFTSTGTLRSDQSFTSVTPFSIEPADVVNTTDPKKIIFSMKVNGTGHDGIDFTFPSTEPVCFDVDTPAGLPIFLGVGRIPMGSTFDLGTLGDCIPSSIPEISIGDVSVNETAGVASFTVGLSIASASNVTVDYATANGTALAPDDFAPESDTITFLPGGPLTQSVDISLVDDMSSEGPENFTVSLSNPVNGALGDSSGTATILDNEVWPCGAPTYDKAVDRAVFIWKNCTTSLWTVRVSGGTGPQYTYAGSVTASQAFTSATGFSIEANDSFVWNSGSNPTVISHSLIVPVGSQDGFDFSFPSGADVCFGVGTSSSIPVYVGAAEMLVPTPFNLTNFGSCN